MVSFPQGLDDVSKYPDLIQELLQRNWTENEVANILRGNFLRVFEEVERVSLKDECICFYDKLRVGRGHICFQNL